MDNNYLAHHGIKGQKWGVRRYQTKDGSLTAAGKKRYAKDNGKKKPTPEETVEQKRARLLKSTDAHELYANKHLLTTNEINERLTRIDTEKRLGSVAAQDKRGFAKVMENAQKAIKTADDIYKLTQSDAVQAVIGKLKGDKANGELVKYDRDDVESILKVKGKLSDKSLAELANRHKSIDSLESKLKNKKDAEEAARKAKEDANKEGAAKKAKEYDDAKEQQDRANAGYKKAKGSKEQAGTEHVTGEVFGEGTSKRKTSTSSKEKVFDIIDVDFTETPISSDKLSGFITVGNQVISLLDEPKG